MQIVSRYSIIVILEVVDKTGKAMTKFLDKLNSKGSVKLINDLFCIIKKRDVMHSFPNTAFVCFAALTRSILTVWN